MQIQGSGVGSQESGVRSQESGAGSATLPSGTGWKECQSGDWRSDAGRLGPQLQLQPIQPFNPSTLQPFNPSTLQPFNAAFAAFAAVQSLLPIENRES